jgi:hypothetical protein
MRTTLQPTKTVLRNAQTQNLIYAAAIIDAKACIASYLIHGEYRAEVIVTSKYRAVCDRLRDVFGVGTVSKTGAVSWRWKTYNADALDVLERSLPHMIAQRENAFALVDFREQFEKKGIYILDT